MWNSTTSSAIQNNHLRPKLESLVNPAQLQAISARLSSIEALTPAQQAVVRTAFAEAYNKQNIFLTAFSGVSLVTSLFLWEKKPRRVQ
jgi:protease II